MANVRSMSAFWCFALCFVAPVLAEGQCKDGKCEILQFDNAEMLQQTSHPHKRGSHKSLAQHKSSSVGKHAGRDHKHDGAQVTQETPTPAAETPCTTDWSVVRRRRVSTGIPGGCNSGAEISGSTNPLVFRHCNYPNMELHENAGSLLNGCKCKAGFQQGPIDCKGSAAICVPCGCKGITKFNGMSLDLCPVKYDSNVFSQSVYMANTFKDELVLPSVQKVQAGLQNLRAMIEEEVQEWFGNETATKKKELEDTSAAFLAELLELHERSTNADDTELHGDLNGIDEVWDTVKAEYAKIYEKLEDASKVAVDQAKTLWSDAKAKVCALRKAAHDFKTELLRRAAALRDKVVDFMQNLKDRFIEKMHSFTAFISEKIEKLMEAVGSLVMNSVGFNLTFTNPTVLTAQVNSVEANIFYKPHAGGTHGSTELLPLGGLKIDHTIDLHAYGTSTLHIGAALGSLNIKVGEILGHGIMGFLEDAQTGKLNLEIDFGNIDGNLMNTDFGWLANLAGSVEAMFNPVIPVELPEDITAKCKDAVAAYNYMTGQTPEEKITPEKIENDALADLSPDWDKERAEIEATTVNVLEPLVKKLEEKENEALKALKEENATATAFTLEVETRVKEDKKWHQVLGDWFSEAYDSFKDAIEGSAKKSTEEVEKEVEADMDETTTFFEKIKEILER